MILLFPLLFLSRMPLKLRPDNSLENENSSKIAKFLTFFVPLEFYLFSLGKLNFGGTSIVVCKSTGLGIKFR